MRKLRNFVSREENAKGKEGRMNGQAGEGRIQEAWNK